MSMMKVESFFKKENWIPAKTLKSLIEARKVKIYEKVSPLYLIAKVALDIICAPVTEVTAERLFSFLANFANAWITMYSKTLFFVAGTRNLTSRVITVKK
jgi:hypothetical protein